MALKGIDVASWQGWPFSGGVERAYNESDFIIAKATQGTGYVNPHCDRAIQRAISDGKLFGFYHYASNGDAVAEADYFVENCKGYFGHGIPVLDFEELENENVWNDHTWARRFVDRVHELTGIWCMVYIQASALERVANCADDCALWIAGYPHSGTATFDPPKFNYSTWPWETYTVWQYTSELYGEVDGNAGNLTADAWARIARGDGSKPSSDSSSKPSSDWVTQAAQDVISGKFGNGEERKQRLYDAVQKRVNELLS